VLLLHALEAVLASLPALGDRRMRLLRFLCSAEVHTPGARVLTHSRQVIGGLDFTVLQRAVGMLDNANVVHALLFDTLTVTDTSSSSSPHTAAAVDMLVQALVIGERACVRACMRARERERGARALTHSSASVATFSSSTRNMCRRAALLVAAHSDVVSASAVVRAIAAERAAGASRVGARCLSMLCRGGA
jgi:hypothetical protein